MVLSQGMVKAVVLLLDQTCARCMSYASLSKLFELSSVIVGIAKRN